MIMDPWSSQTVDYKKIIKEFGVSEISDDIRQFVVETAKSKNVNSKWFTHNIIFSHRDFDKFIDAHKRGESIAILTGVKPSGEFHFGTKQVIQELIMFQKLFNAKTYYCVADFEAYADNGKWIDETSETAVSNVADVLALGLDPNNAYIYRQSMEPIVQKFAYYFSRKITNATFRALYGDKSFSLYLSALTQIGDILLPQSDEHSGPKHVLVPVGIDQDPHLRLTRDVAEKNGFITPSSTYHYFMKSLDGSQKMSKRNPDSMLTLSDSDDDIKRKISKALTGGRDTVHEQKEKGGQPEKCMVYELSYYHVENIDELESRRQKCKSGELTCGECKKEIISKLITFMNKHREKKKLYLPLARAIVEKGRFDGQSREGQEMIKRYLVKI